MGPAPMIKQSASATSPANSAIRTAQPTGSVNAPMRLSMPSGSLSASFAETLMYSAKAPGRCAPISRRLPQS